MSNDHTVYHIPRWSGSVWAVGSGDWERGAAPMTSRNAHHVTEYACRAINTFCSSYHMDRYRQSIKDTMTYRSNPWSRVTCRPFHRMTNLCLDYLSTKPFRFGIIVHQQYIRWLWTEIGKRRRGRNEELGVVFWLDWKECSSDKSLPYICQS